MSSESLLNAVQTSTGRRSEQSLERIGRCAISRPSLRLFHRRPGLAAVAGQHGLSCGNPVALAGLREGEVVVDLGCGGGLDVFLAAKRVGPTGKAIGIDMNARHDRARECRGGAGGSHECRVPSGPDRPVALPEASVDCIISNCVINLVPDKSRAFRKSCGSSSRADGWS